MSNFRPAANSHHRQLVSSNNQNQNQNQNQHLIENNLQSNSSKFSQQKLSSDKNLSPAELESKVSGSFNSLNSSFPKSEGETESGPKPLWTRLDIKRVEIETRKLLIKHFVELIENTDKKMEKSTPRTPILPNIDTQSQGNSSSIELRQQANLLNGQAHYVPESQMVGSIPTVMGSQQPTKLPCPNSQSSDFLPNNSSETGSSTASPIPPVANLPSSHFTFKSNYVLQSSGSSSKDSFEKPLQRCLQTSSANIPVEEHASSGQNSIKSFAEYDSKAALDITPFIINRKNKGKAVSANVSNSLKEEKDLVYQPNQNHIRTDNQKSGHWACDESGIGCGAGKSVEVRDQNGNEILGPHAREEEPVKRPNASRKRSNSFDSDDQPCKRGRYDSRMNPGTGCEVDTAIAPSVVDRAVTSEANNNSVAIPNQPDAWAKTRNTEGDGIVDFYSTQTQNVENYLANNFIEDHLDISAVASTSNSNPEAEVRFRELGYNFLDFWQSSGIGIKPLQTDACQEIPNDTGTGNFQQNENASIPISFTISEEVLKEVFEKFTHVNNDGFYPESYINTSQNPTTDDVAVGVSTPTETLVISDGATISIDASQLKKIVEEAAKNAVEAEKQETSHTLQIEEFTNAPFTSYSYPIEGFTETVIYFDDEQELIDRLRRNFIRP